MSRKLHFLKNRKIRGKFGSEGAVEFRGRLGMGGPAQFTRNFSICGGVAEGEPRLSPGWGEPLFVRL